MTGGGDVSLIQHYEEFSWCGRKARRIMRARDEFSREATKPVEFERREWKDFEGDAETDPCDRRQWTLALNTYSFSQVLASIPKSGLLWSSVSWGGSLFLYV